jgi:hypothetical protein
MKHVILFVFFFYVNLNSQIVNIRSFDLTNTNLSLTGSAFISDANSNLFHFWADSAKLFYSKSNNAGISWTTPFLLHETTYTISQVSSLISTSGRIFVFYRDIYINYKYSDDNGTTWSEKLILPTGTGIGASNTKYGFSITAPSGSLYYIYSRNTVTNSKGVFRIVSTDNGITWSSEQKLLDNPNAISPSLISSDNGVEKLFYLKSTSTDTIFSITSTDFGSNWQLNEKAEYVSSSKINSVVSFVDGIGKYYLVYEEELQTAFEGFANNEIMFLSSTNLGLNWSPPESLTKYKGYDSNPRVCKLDGKPFVSFYSKRNLTNTNSLKTWYGLINESNDFITPPMVYKSISFLDDSFPSKAFFRSLIEDDNQINSVELLYEINGKPQTSLFLYDNGTNGDSLSNDKIYSAEIPNALYKGDNLVFKIRAIDEYSNETLQYGGVLMMNTEGSFEVYLLEANRLKLPLNNAGIIADETINGISNATYDGQIVLFSSGFYLSGLNNSQIWANAISSSARIQDYRPGNVGIHYDDPRNKIYVVSITDAPFSDAWQNWKTAVTMGADFYDGNNDGIYNPVDYNSNGIWDPNEDKPDILGDVTTYCVYNDVVPSHLRRFNDVNPLGIEIHQTVFAFADSSSNSLNNTIYVRYKIFNSGNVAIQFDSVYFSFFADPDIGDMMNDYAGSDTILQSAYVYQKSSDPLFGDAVPAFFTSIIQGPHDYESGVTFIDNNNNGIFDDGIDTPLDTAYYNSGPLGVRKIPGAANRQMTSAMSFACCLSMITDPQNTIQARNLMLGKANNGMWIDPCIPGNWTVGGGVNCSSVDPKFIFSGNPVTNYGWVSTTQSDQRYIISTGPFTLKQNEPVEIMGALLVGRKDDPFSSFYEARRIASYVRSFYKSNFGEFPLGVENEQINNVKNFELFQNYPNPFNPVTTIKYQIPEAGLVSLKVYNILGEEVTTLVNEIKRSGSYTIDFNAGKLASGVYIYELSSNHLRTIKKFLLMK